MLLWEQTIGDNYHAVKDKASDVVDCGYYMDSWYKIQDSIQYGCEKFMDPNKDCYQRNQKYFLPPEHSVTGAFWWFSEGSVPNQEQFTVGNCLSAPKMVQFRKKSGEKLQVQTSLSWINKFCISLIIRILGYGLPLLKFPFTANPTSSHSSLHYCT